MNFVTLIFSLVPLLFLSATEIPANIDATFKAALIEDDYETASKLLEEYPGFVTFYTFLDALTYELPKVVDLLCNNLHTYTACSIGVLFMILIKDRVNYPVLLKIAEQWRTPEQDGRFPLITAAEMGGRKIVADLLQIPRILKCIDTQDDEGNTALHHAACTGTVKLLLDHGADCTLKNSNLGTCLHTTTSQMHFLMFDIEKYKSEHWPSTAAFQSDYTELKRYVKVLKAFILKGLDPYESNAHNLNVFDRIMMEFHEELKEVLSLRVQVQKEMKAIEDEFELGPNQSYLAWLPSPDLSGLLNSYILHPLDLLIAHNLQ